MRLFLYIVVLSIAISGCKKKYNMTGRMMDQSSSQPVPGIHIKLNQCTDSKSNCSGVVIGTGTTDGDGKYVISGKYSKKGSFYLSYTVNGIGYHIRLNNPPPKEADLIVP